MEIKNEEEVPTLENHDLVIIVLFCTELVRGRDKPETILASLHDLIEGLEILILEPLVLSQIEASPAMMVAPVVKLSRKVHPFRVPKLIANEVQVCLSSKTEHQQPHHFVKSQAAIYYHARFTECAHVSVHFLVHEPASCRLISHDALIMRFNIRHYRFLPPPVLERECDVAEIPVMIWRLLEQLDPHVRNCHRQAVVEAKAAIRYRAAESWHARNIFRDCHSRSRQQVVNKLVGQHAVHVRFLVCIFTKVLVIATTVALVDAVRMIQHARDSIKSETVETKFLQPPTNI
mmetsp:Transcript_86476/g.171679  ORF Transcript_86476/g.171679 Transcript_86476/m.171679 type:complete len:290 (-) Transcript_86476:962-1831(-)